MGRICVTTMRAMLLTLAAVAMAGLAVAGPPLDPQETSSAQIHGQVWKDLDGDGQPDNGEGDLAGWQIYLDLNGNGQCDVSEPTTTTNASGAYSFTALAAGTYTVAEVVKSGWRQTYPGTHAALAGQEPKPVPSPGELAINIADSPPTPPPVELRPVAQFDSQSVLLLDNVPTSTWTYGCSATSAGMLFGYYDRTGYNNMYTGPCNGGMCPMSNLGQGINAPIPRSCSIIATMRYFDGRATFGHVNDYWISTNSPGPDPFQGVRAEHTWGGCTADYMGTNQWKWDYNLNGTKDANIDGSTVYYSNTGGAKLYDYIPLPAYGLPQTELCHGLRLFAESRGYTVVENYTQLIDTVIEAGFSFANYMAEIDAGRPVLIQLVGHTMVGVGYEPVGNVVFVHDTWDNAAHVMTWGGSYGGMAHRAVTVIFVGRPGTNVVTLTEGAIDTGAWFGNQVIPKITVKCPSRGSVVTRGHNCGIHWTCAGNVGSYVSIRLYWNSSLKGLIKGRTANDGDYRWLVPATLPPGSHYRLKITSCAHSSIYSVGGYFRIRS